MKEKIEIPISDHDIENFQDLIYKHINNFIWSFESNKGNDIDVEFYFDEEGLHG